MWREPVTFGGGMTIVPRADFTYTGKFWARSFNKPIDRITGYEVVTVRHRNTAIITNAI